MPEPVLLSDYRMKKNTAPKESESPVDLKTIRELKAEMMARFSSHDEQFKQIDSRFTQVDARFDELNAKIDQVSADIKAMYHESKLMMEEQNLRNKQAYDGYTTMYEAVYNLKNNIKLECLKD